MRKLEYLQKILAQRQQGSSAKKCREYITEHTEIKKRKERLIHHKSSCEHYAETGGFGIMFRLLINGTLAQGQLVPMWSIRIIYYSDKDKHGDYDIFGETQHHCVGQKGLKKMGVKWNSSEETLQRQQRRSLCGREAALVHQSRILLSNMAPLPMYEGCRMTNEETHIMLTHAYTLSSSLPYTDTHTRAPFMGTHSDLQTPDETVG